MQLILNGLKFRWKSRNDNRPDVQWNHGGRHYNYEVDRNIGNSNKHKEVIMTHDPFAEFEIKILNKKNGAIDDVIMKK